MNKFLSILIVVFLVSCNSDIDKKETRVKVVRDTIEIVEKYVDTLYIEKESENNFNTSFMLPEWVLESDIFDGIKLKNNFELDNRLNPFYLEADYNGDGHLDIALAIKETQTERTGFVIIHGKTNEIHIIGAGKEVENGISDDMDFIDIWKVNRKKINEAGVGEKTGNGQEGELNLNNPSLRIEKSEVGGGLIYWNGSKYAYFHQTC